MKIQRYMGVVAALVLCASTPFHAQNASAQVFDFGQIDAFESLGSGTQRGGSAPKTLVDDDGRHIVVFTILESNTTFQCPTTTMVICGRRDAQDSIEGR